MPVLVLNASYEPVHITRARRALVLLIKGIAVIEEAHDRYVHVGLQLQRAQGRSDTDGSRYEIAPSAAPGDDSHLSCIHAPDGCQRREVEEVSVLLKKSKTRVEPAFAESVPCRRSLLVAPT